MGLEMKRGYLHHGCGLQSFECEAGHKRALGGAGRHKVGKSKGEKAGENVTNKSKREKAGENEADL
jgi:hypothetical protein